MLMCLSSPRGWEACGDQRHRQRRIVGQLPPVLVCWGRGIGGLSDRGYRCRDGRWVAKPHGARRCSQPGYLWPLLHHLVQGQSVWGVQGGPLRPGLCRHHHRYQRWGSLFPLFPSSSSANSALTTVFPCGLSKEQILVVVKRCLSIQLWCGSLWHYIDSNRCYRNTCWCLVVHCQTSISAINFHVLMS